LIPPNLLHGAEVFSGKMENSQSALDVGSGVNTGDGVAIGVAVSLGVTVRIRSGVTSGELGVIVGDSARYGDGCGVTPGVSVGDAVVPTDSSTATTIAPSIMSEYLTPVVIGATNWQDAAVGGVSQVYSYPN
jgi:acetyltransferase-like isoleucine patch superfamily enzyme